MGSLTFDGVRFRIYSDDHHPPHAHGFYGESSVVVEFGDSDNISVRRGSVQPPNAKRSDLFKIVQTAVENYEESLRMWEATHGSFKSRY